jgi:O-antigen biosynthesis protein
MSICPLQNSFQQGLKGWGTAVPSFREVLKRAMPTFIRQTLNGLQDKLERPPLEDAVLHDYELAPDTRSQPRLSLLIPSISPKKAFGGVATGIETFMEIGKRTAVQLRILLDDFEPVDTTVVAKCARDASVELARIEIVPRRRWVPRIDVRADDVFCTFNWWTTLNVRSLLREQYRIFGGLPRPHLYLIQEYEPLFYRMSSTHMMAGAAFQSSWPCWGLFNSGELYAFFLAQGHRIERAFVFEPKLSASMRPFLGGETPLKARRILIYGRPSQPRNCFPAIAKGLQQWARKYPEFSGWEVISVGLPHPPVRFGPQRVMKSLGKLSLEDYGKLLRGSAVGLSLMASPHPSYPPLEMAHFGLRTITNTYANKDLSTSHPNIMSIRDLGPNTIADALAQACRTFEADHAAGWLAPSNRPSFLEPAPFSFIEEIVGLLKREMWLR